MAGEIVGQIQQARIETKLKDAIQNKNLTRAEAYELVRDMRANGLKMAKLAGGLSAALVGGDVNAGANAGGNAAENNAFWIPIIIIVAVILETTDKVLFAKDAYHIADETMACQGGSQDSCDRAVELAKQAAIDAGIEFTIGNVIPGSKAAADLWRWLRKNVDPDTLKNIDKATDAAHNGGNRTATQVDVADHFQQNRRFWSSEPIEFNGSRVYQRNDLFDPNQTSTWTRNGQEITGTNVQRMAAGNAPVDMDGNPVVLHHMTQTQSGAIAEVSQTFHTSNYGTIHINTGKLPSGISRSQFNTWRTNYWMNRAATFGE